MYWSIWIVLYFFLLVTNLKNIYSRIKSVLSNYYLLFDSWIQTQKCCKEHSSFLIYVVVVCILDIFKCEEIVSNGGHGNRFSNRGQECGIWLQLTSLTKIYYLNMEINKVEVRTIGHVSTVIYINIDNKQCNFVI